MIFNTNLFTSGAKVCLSDINEKLGEESLRELSQQFGEDVVAFQVCDVTKEDSVKRLIEEAERKLNSPLYCFINNAGIRLYPGASLNWTHRIPKYGDDGVSDQSVSGVMGENHRLLSRIYLHTSLSIYCNINRSRTTHVNKKQRQKS